MRNHRLAWFLLGCCLFVGRPGMSRWCQAGEAPGQEVVGSYHHEVLPAGPCSIHVFQTEFSQPGWRITTTLGKDGNFGVATLTDQVKGLPPAIGRPVAAINGDFFDTSEDYGGGPRDLQIFQGQLVRSPAGHACFWLDTFGKPHLTNLVSQCRILLANGQSIPFELNVARPADGCVLYTPVLGATTRTSGGTELILAGGSDDACQPLRAASHLTAKVREVKTGGNSPLRPGTMVLSLGPKLMARLPAIGAGAQLEIFTDTVPSLAGVETAIGGGPTLVRDGQAMHWSGINVRTPRAAIGWNQKQFFLVEVDGRQKSSAGMSFPEFANYLVKLGCENALNLDGGGSSTLWVQGKVVNSPSEGRERSSANAVVIVQQPRGTPEK